MNWKYFQDISILLSLPWSGESELFLCLPHSSDYEYVVYLRGGAGISNRVRIFDQNESCRESCLNLKLFWAKSATLKFRRLTVKKHNKTVKKAVFCIL